MRGVSRSATCETFTQAVVGAESHQGRRRRGLQGLSGTSAEGVAIARAWPRCMLALNSRMALKYQREQRLQVQNFKTMRKRH